MRKRLFLCFSLVLVLGLCLCLSACGHSHTWIEATCTTAKTCSECGETEGDALGHDWIEATCTEPKTCSRCGTTEGEPLGHTWISATCISPETCSVCGFVSDGPLGDHSCDQWSEEEDSTCTSEGYKTGVCKYCSEPFTITIPMKEHEYSAWAVSIPATCSSVGEEERACKNCQHRETRQIDMLPHELGDWVVVETPSYTKDGQKAQYCQVCAELINEEPYTFSEFLSDKITIKGERDSVEVTDLSYFIDYNDFWPRFYLIVELTNIGNDNLKLYSCKCDLLNDEHILLDQVDELYFSTAPSIIAPGEKGYFFVNWGYDVGSLDLNNGLTVKAEVTVNKSSKPPQQFAVSQVNWNPSSYDVLGYFENTTKSPTDSIHLIAVFKDSDGRAVAFSWTSLDPVEPGDSTSFKIQPIWGRTIYSGAEIAGCQVIAFDFWY